MAYVCLLHRGDPLTRCGIRSISWINLFSVSTKYVATSAGRLRAIRLEVIFLTRVILRYVSSPPSLESSATPTNMMDARVAALTLGHASFCKHLYACDSRSKCELSSAAQFNVFFFILFLHSFLLYLAFYFGLSWPSFLLPFLSYFTSSSTSLDFSHSAWTAVYCPLQGIMWKNSVSSNFIN